MKVLVIGQSGQVARSLSESAKLSSVELTVLGRPQLDVLDDKTVTEALDQYCPNVVINTAAYTAVDIAESEPNLAKALNADAVERLAQLTADRDLPLFHLSTDYVFDGQDDHPYPENAATRPLNTYGATKLAGEKAVATANPNHIILRTAWIYSPYGRNFVESMLRLARDRDELTIVDDQIGHPTYAPDLADALLEICTKTGSVQPIWGLFHLAGREACSWADFAEEIFLQSAKQGGPTAMVTRIQTTDYPTPASRPLQSRLNMDKILQTYAVTLPSFRTRVETCVAALL